MENQERIEKININGVDYVRADAVPSPAQTMDGNPFVIIRTVNAGVFAGYLRTRYTEQGIVSVIMDRCIRLWRWTGCSLSQVANYGIAGTGENKFSVETDAHEIIGVIEIIQCTEAARIKIQAVEKWKL